MSPLLVTTHVMRKVRYWLSLVIPKFFARQQPAEFQVSQVIQGWTEGLQLMKEGAKYRFFIPAKLGYGQIGSGDVIEPNSTLIFDVELIEVLPK
jgi:FKBP-type peptidyl-prolyl cis-trans isomerase FklB